jgi:hypothetical protein
MADGGGVEKLTELTKKKGKYISTRVLDPVVKRQVPDELTGEMTDVEEPNRQPTTRYLFPDNTYLDIQASDETPNKIIGGNALDPGEAGAAPKPLIKRTNPQTGQPEEVTAEQAGYDRLVTADSAAAKAAELDAQRAAGKLSFEQAEAEYTKWLNESTRQDKLALEQRSRADAERARADAKAEAAANRAIDQQAEDRLGRQGDRSASLAEDTLDYNRRTQSNAQGQNAVDNYLKQLKYRRPAGFNNKFAGGLNVLGGHRGGGDRWQGSDFEFEMPDDINSIAETAAARAHAQYTGLADAPVGAPVAPVAPPAPVAPIPAPSYAQALAPPTPGAPATLAIDPSTAAPEQAAALALLPPPQLGAPPAAPDIDPLTGLPRYRPPPVAPWMVGA